MADSSPALDFLRFSHGDQLYLIPCTEVIAYFSGSLFDHRDAIRSFYRVAQRLVGDRIRFYRTETMGAARPVKKDSLDLLPFWLDETAAKRDIYMLFLEGGAVADEPSQHAFEMNYSPGRGYVRLVLPAAMALETPDQLLEIALEAMKDFSFEFGNAGLSVNWNYLGKFIRRSQLAMNSLAPRFSGVDMSYALPTQFILADGMKCINWLTFVGAAGLERLGGIAALSQRVAPAGSVLALGHGACVKAGDVARLGDSNAQDDMKAYRVVGHALAPFRARKHPAIFGPGGIPDEETTRQWLARFDGSPS